MAAALERELQLRRLCRYFRPKDRVCMRLTKGRIKDLPNWEDRHTMYGPHGTTSTTVQSPKTPRLHLALTIKEMAFGTRSTESCSRKASAVALSLLEMGSFLFQV